jgi:hypothetical protein
LGQRRDDGVPMPDGDAMSIYATLLSFDDISGLADGPPPLVYQGSHVPPTVGAQRGGDFDVSAAVVAPVDGDLPALRFGITTASGTHATVLLDGFQVARLARVLSDWLSMEVPE